jgi:hypothetical protein
MTDDLSLDAIRARDAAIQRCLTCGGYSGGAHDSTVEECEAALIKQSKASGRDWRTRRYEFYTDDPSEIAERSENLGPKHLCWYKRDHHPFVEDVDLTTEYEDAVRDRRVLLRLMDELEAMK